MKSHLCDISYIHISSFRYDPTYLEFVLIRMALELNFHTLNNDTLPLYTNKSIWKQVWLHSTFSEAMKSNQAVC